MEFGVLKDSFGHCVFCEKVFYSSILFGTIIYFDAEMRETVTKIKSAYKYQKRFEYFIKENQIDMIVKEVGMSTKNT